MSLFFLLALALEGVRGFKRVVIVMAVMGVYAALDEITQQFVSRSPALADWCADMIGAGLAVLLWQIAAAIRERSKRAIRQA